MPAFRDRTGERYGRLLVRTHVGFKNRRTYWDCVCDCGKSVIVMGQSLTAGTTVSCGCFRLEQVRRNSGTRTHGFSKTRTYGIWAGIKKRCLNPRSHAFDRYGGRGIRICDQWLRFENFLADMGLCPSGFSIERLNCDGHYEPGNCIWADDLTQNRNRRNSRTALCEGAMLPLSEIAKRTNSPYATVYYRAVTARQHMRRVTSVHDLSEDDPE